MNTYWLIWIAVLVVGFTIGERYAFQHPTRQNTLSRFVWTVGQHWPLSLVLWGMLIGGLSVHFFWNWCPALMPVGTGG